MAYTMVAIALSFGAGVALGEFFGRAASIPVWLGVASAVFLIALFGKRWPRVTRTAALVAVCLLGIVRVASVPAFPDWLMLRAAGLRQLTGTVASYPEIGTDRIGFVLQPDGLPGRLQVAWYEPPEVIGSVHRGDRVEVVGRTRLPEVFDGFDYPRYLARQGIFATMALERESGLMILSTGGRSLLSWGDRLRQSILAALRERLQPTDFAMAQSLLFGDRSALPDEIEEAFSRTGLMHLLAVSGLHLGIFLGGIWWVLRALGLRPRITYPLVGLIVLLALWVVGPRISLVRAALLFAFLGLGSVLADCGLVLRRWVRPLNALAAAAVVILALRPGALHEAGFQLTVAATASILIAFSATAGWAKALLARSRRGGRWGALREHVLRLLLVAAAAQAGATPIIAWHFGTLHPVSILANVVVVPLAGVALWCGLVGIVLLGVHAGAWAILPLGGALVALRSIVAGLSRIPLSAVPVPRWMALWTGALIAFAVLAGLLGVFGSLAGRLVLDLEIDIDAVRRPGPAG
ncbi:ComEC/Rec2 family competence protein [Candidatus Bipolaricaulota bacterium]